MEENSKIDSFEKYKVLINARNFHYENFNKWMTYFYVAIGALFVGYYTLISSISSSHTILQEITLLVLGFLISLYWYWSSKGYYYWNINFITLVNYYEEKILNFKKEDRIYFVFANKNTQNNYLNPIKGANISTSKVAILFAFTVTSVWGILLSYKLLEVFGDTSDLLKLISSIVLVPAFIILLSYLIPKFLLKSKIDHFPDLKIEQKKTDNEYCV